MSTNIFYHVTLTLEFDLLPKNIDLIDNFSTVSARVFIFNMEISCDKIVLLVLNLWTLTFENFLKLTLVITSKINIRALSLHMSISWNKIFLPVYIKIFVLVTLTISGIGNHRGICVSQTCCFILELQMADHFLYCISRSALGLLYSRKDRMVHHLHDN